MEYNESGEVQVPEEKYETVREILELREQGPSFSEIGERTDVSRATAWRVCKRAD